MSFEAFNMQQAHAGALGSHGGGGAKSASCPSSYALLAFITKTGFSTTLSNTEGILPAGDKAGINGLTKGNMTGLSALNTAQDSKLTQFWKKLGDDVKAQAGKGGSGIEAPSLGGMGISGGQDVEHIGAPMPTGGRETSHGLTVN